MVSTRVDVEALLLVLSQDEDSYQVSSHLLAPHVQKAPGRGRQLDTKYVLAIKRFKRHLPYCCHRTRYQACLVLTMTRKAIGTNKHVLQLMKDSPWEPQAYDPGKRVRAWPCRHFKGRRPLSCPAHRPCPPTPSIFTAVDGTDVGTPGMPYVSRAICPSGHDTKDLLHYRNNDPQIMAKTIMPGKCPGLMWPRLFLAA